MSKNIKKSPTTSISKSYVVINSRQSKAIEKQSKPLKENTKKDFSEDIDFFEDFSSYQRPGKIIHQSTEQSYDKKGNKVTKTKIIRELEDSSSNNKYYHERKTSNNQPKNITNTKNQNNIYYSPDFQEYESPKIFKSNINDKNIKEIGYKTNYIYESKKINGKNVGEYSTKEKYEYIDRNGAKESVYEKSVSGSPRVTEIISPVHYVENSSGGSDLDENQIKSFDNYHFSIQTDNINRNNINKNKAKLKYELEDPEGFDYITKNERKISNDEFKNTSKYINRSQIRKKYDDSSKSDIRDFQSPDKNIERKNFRKINMGMITDLKNKNQQYEINNKKLEKENTELKIQLNNREVEDNLNDDDMINSFTKAKIDELEENNETLKTKNEELISKLEEKNKEIELYKEQNKDNNITKEK